jgi:hypothetical protein
MKWWWSGKDGVKMTEEEFFELLDDGICSEFSDFLELLEGKGYYIPFVTTVNYLSHPTTKSAFGPLEDYSKLTN